MIVTRIAYSKNLNIGKFNQLKELAKRLGQIRTEIWQRFGSINGVGKTDRQIRDNWLKQQKQFNVLANAWKETLRDAIGDIKASRESAKQKTRQAIIRHTTDEQERKRLFTLLKSDQWTLDPYFSRTMRKYWIRGHNHTFNQIIVRSDNYQTFQKGNQAYISIPGLEPRKCIVIPLNTTVPPTGTLRIIIKDGLVEIHYPHEVLEKKNCGSKIIGVDKGYTEVFVDSAGEKYGQNLGSKLSSESDHKKQKYQNRNKIKAIADKKPHKRQNIEKNNLGRKKLDQKKDKSKGQIRDIVFKAVHALVEKAGTIAAEDLTSPISGRKFSKNVNRRLSGWVKGLIAEALILVSQRRCSTLIHVNPAYTSQVDSRHGILLGKRVGDVFYCFDGEKLQADMNAARNVLARLYDQEIGLWTPYKKVKSILLERTERLRLGLLNQDSSCSKKLLSTESELPNGQFCPDF